MRELFMLALGLAISVAVTVAPAHAANGDCGQPSSLGSQPMVSDCLHILRASVGSTTCTPPCICDTTGNGSIQVSDALLCLRVAVNNPGAVVDCDCPTTTTSTTTTSTTTTTTTTTTTLPPQCRNIEDEWFANGNGNGKGCCTITTEDGNDSFCEELISMGYVDVDQHQCTAGFAIEYPPLDLYLDFQGPVTQTKWVFTGEWFPDPDDYDLTCTQNLVRGEATINAAADRLDIKFTGGMKCSREEISFNCTASGSEQWAR